MVKKYSWRLAAFCFFLVNVVCPPAMAEEAAPTTALETESGAHYPWKGPLPSSPDWGGVGRDTAYFLGWQFLAIGTLYVMPESISGWGSEEKDSYSIEKYKDNLTPVWDQDKAVVNYVLHPYWGATYYTRARERGLGRMESFLVSALWSSLYEFGAEAMFEPVSKQDLFVTPVIGSLIGEYWFAPLRERIRNQPGGMDGWDKTIMVLTDPFGFANAWADSVLGIKSNISIQRTSVAPAKLDTMTQGGASPPQSGEKMWTLSMRAVW
jgi:Domain of unknown function (DUF3943)